SVKEWNGEVIFLHEIVPGAADRSYGIQVAKLAGLPATVVERSKQVLSQLEEQDRRSPSESLIDELPLFASIAPPVPSATSAEPDPVTGALEDIDPDDMTPREALEALYRLKSLRAERTG
ncbi:MAG: DNA mismatch repair protein MutS, partial [Roseibium sp.]